MAELQPNTPAAESLDIEQLRRHGYEPNTLNVTFVWTVIFGLGLLVLLAMGLMWVMFLQLASQGQRPPEVPASLRQVQPPPVEPSLDVSQQKTLQEMRATEEELLSSYEWIDEQQGVARIPIDRAIQIILENGLPEPTGPPAADAEKVSAKSEEADDGDQ